MPSSVVELLTVNASRSATVLPVIRLAFTVRSLLPLPVMAPTTFTVVPLASSVVSPVRVSVLRKVWLPVVTRLPVSSRAPTVSKLLMSVKLAPFMANSPPERFSVRSLRSPSRLALKVAMLPLIVTVLVRVTLPE